MNTTVKGRLRALRSFMREVIREEELVPWRKRAALGFSVGRGARLASARAERAFFGLLIELCISFVLGSTRARNVNAHLSKHHESREMRTHS